MNNLKELRIKNNISQADIARYLDVSQSLKGHLILSCRNVADLLGCSLDELAGRKKFIDRKEN